MKRTLVFFLLSFFFLAVYSYNKGPSDRTDKPVSDIKAGKDHSIVGRWEYVKTILPDGSEISDLVATEHYYSDGTLLYVNIWLAPKPLTEFTNSTVEVVNNYKQGYGGIASYHIEKGTETDILHYQVVSSTQVERIGNKVSVEIKVEKDTLIFYFDNGNQYILKRVRDK